MKVLANITMVYSFIYHGNFTSFLNQALQNFLKVHFLKTVVHGDHPLQVINNLS